MADPSNLLANGKPKPEGYTFGRPTKYRPEYCQAIIDYFNIPSTVPSRKIITTAKGTKIVEETERANSLPTIEGFAGSLETTTETVVAWTKEHPDFFTAYTRAKAMQKQILIDNGTKGLYNSQFTIFVAKNCTDMKDKVEVEGHLDMGITVQVISRFVDHPQQVGGAASPKQITDDNSLHNMDADASHQVSVRNDSD